VGKSDSENRKCPHCDIDAISNVGIWLGPVAIQQCDSCGYKMMAELPHRQAVGDLANALQVALCVSTGLTNQNAGHEREFRKLQDALNRAVTALDKLRGG
jgi:hypothetical protein